MGSSHNIQTAKQISADGLSVTLLLLFQFHQPGQRALKPIDAEKYLLLNRRNNTRISY
jgi:hypothetical protein